MKIWKALVLIPLGAVVLLVIAGGASAAGIGPERMRGYVQGATIVAMLGLWFVRVIWDDLFSAMRVLCDKRSRGK